MEGTSSFWMGGEGRWTQSRREGGGGGLGRVGVDLALVCFVALVASEEMTRSYRQFLLYLQSTVNSMQRAARISSCRPVMRQDPCPIHVCLRPSPSSIRLIYLLPLPFSPSVVRPGGGAAAGAEHRHNASEPTGSHGGCCRSERRLPPRSAVQYALWFQPS